MRTYYYPTGNDARIISGESGAAGLGAVLVLCENESMAAVRGQIGLNKDSRILLLNTEGDTDPVHFRQVVSRDS
jgi:diaminopropionate ammonia-lyase